MKKYILVMLTFVASIAFVSTGMEYTHAEVYEDEGFHAAPAVAGLLLEEAGIDNRYGTGKNGGNYISEVARNMAPETDFNGAKKENTCEYAYEVAIFLNSRLISSGDTQRVSVKEPGAFDAAASSAMAIDNEDGTVTLAITVKDQCGEGITDLDPLSDFYVMDSVIAGQFYFGTGSIPGSEIGEWTYPEDGVYAVTLERNFFHSRPAGYEDGWYRIWDIFVKGELVEDNLELKTTYFAVGEWSMDLYVGAILHARYVVIDTHVDGEVDGFFGIGYDPDGNPTGTIEGIIDGNTIHMYYERPPALNYSANFYGTIAADGNSMSGTWTDSGSIVNQPWTMERI